MDDPVAVARIGGAEVVADGEKTFVGSHDEPFARKCANYKIFYTKLTLLFYNDGSILLRKVIAGTSVTAPPLGFVFSFYTLFKLNRI